MTLGSQIIERGGFEFVLGAKLTYKDCFRFPDGS